MGLGLLGGKYALELTKAGFHVDGINRSEGHLQYALDQGYIVRGKTHDFEDLVREADHIIFGLYPTALIQWFKTYGALLKPGCIFTDVSGVKTGLVEPVQALCPDGVEFIASHPMAGRETSSVEHAAEVNFAPANFIITPTEKNTPAGIAWAKELAEVLGFKHICTLTVEEHDKMIGYVSQLCHAIAVSLMCANDNTSLCEYTGASFRDLTAKSSKRCSACPPGAARRSTKSSPNEVFVCLSRKARNPSCSRFCASLRPRPTKTIC